ncbi:hypothetical protein [Legionella cincinnatiensis]|uniref:Uncharacterized protein n=1 Tax=Legionella cincinnatiensis TaxID=28085 RepID=A0A378INI6_9GAMM|nr:hypothetical protein [Legionella cincinnatiensis]KTC85264.1 hypothetical protein Lcin_1764 [Legionella cincinnatiensis]STX36372.1 Uncharacterised protein [Legionella cincinnatiensis]
MFAKKDSSLRAKTENLWDNICVYRKDSAKQISKSYGHNLTEIINNLQSFSGVKSYSGHQSGRKGDGENKSAMKVLDNAILHLKNCLANTDEAGYSMR